MYRALCVYPVSLLITVRYVHVSSSESILIWFCSFCYNNIVNFDKEFSHINQVCSIEHGLLSTCQNLCYWYRGIFIGKFWRSLMSTRSAKHALDNDHLEISFRGIQQQAMQHIGHHDWNNRNEAFTQLH